ncbi:MAG: chromosome partitioning protein ParB [Pseudomonadota bacterium]|nr:chromosome partitioning protein ParB [Pseudomonadota bacterium]
MSYSRRDPVLHSTAIADLRPTQMTVGLIEVERKRGDWTAKDEAKKTEALASHMIPVVLGPGGQRYITDHHHLARALWDDGQKSVFVTVIGDLRKADAAHFWTLMDYHGWSHPYDSKGRRCDYRDLPKTVQGLENDPYRSLAGALRRAGGFAKDSTPFSEFVWADFFRSRIKVRDIQRDYDGVVAQALALAKSADADYLPGWCGPHDSAREAAPAAKRKAKKPAR